MFLAMDGELLIFLLQFLGSYWQSSLLSLSRCGGGGDVAGDDDRDCGGQC